MSQKGVSKILKALITGRYTQNELAIHFNISQPSLNAQLNGKDPFPVPRIRELVKLLQPGADILQRINKELSEYQGVYISEDGEANPIVNWTKPKRRAESSAPDPLDHDKLIEQLEIEKKIAVLKLERARISRKIEQLEAASNFLIAED